MRDDTGEDMPSLGRDGLEKVKGLWKFQVHRARAQVWAHRDIRFLIYDDTEDEHSQTLKGKSPAKAGDTFAVSVPQPQTGPSSLAQRSTEAIQDGMLQQAILESLKSRDSFKNQIPTADAGPSTIPPDDTEDEDITDPDIQEAIRMSLMSGNESEHTSPQAATETPMAQTFADAANDDCHCVVCSDLPTFPHDKRTRKFRLFSPPPETFHRNNAKDPPRSVCPHYVAVSYCWPEPVRDENGDVIRPTTESQVRDLNGISRPARALDDVLDRAVDFANSFGLRMIWIDQECLPQPDNDSPDDDKEYQQLGVQAMDIVYNRAILTAGLLSSTIESQAQIDAIRALIAYGRNARYPLSPSPQLFNNILDFLAMVESDRWYTRAWVIQEAVSAGCGLVLVFRRAPGLAYCSAMRVRGAPGHPLISNPSDRILKSEIICIGVDEFRGLVRTTKSLLVRSHRAVGQVLVRTSTALPILSAAESLHPAVTKANFAGDCRMYGGMVYGGRQKVNAATALTLLKSRHCRDVQDRLAIVANMCSYEIRLDTDKVAKHCDSLRMGLLAIALLNGDTSILVPEVYGFPDDEGPELASLTGYRSGTGSLLSPFDTDSKRINSYIVENGGLVNPTVYKASTLDTNRKGLIIPANIWTIEDTLDLSPIKYQFAEIWHDMKCLRMGLSRQKEETQDEFVTRQGLIAQHFSKGGMMQQAKLEIFHRGSIDPDSAVWGGLNSAGIQVTTYLDADRVEAVPDMQRTVADIFFAILRYLDGLSTPQAAGVANSIWQSIRVDVVDKSQPGLDTSLPDFAQDLPDIVGQELFSHPAVLQYPFQTLQLGKNRFGGYNEAWLVDRIMEHGVLWFGKYDRISQAPSGCQDKESRNSEGSLRQYVERRRESKSEPKRPDTILTRQLFRLTAATMAKAVAEYEDFEDSQTNINSCNMTWALDMYMRGGICLDTEEARAQQLTSVFNVDGPCTVATPFNPDWEVLPRHELRSMSVCWVVEPVHEGGEGVLGKRKRKTQGETLVPADGKGKGPEQLLEVSVTEGLKPPSSRGEAMDSFVESVNNIPGLRVLDKVKGMWEIMDLPWRDVSFI